MIRSVSKFKNEDKTTGEFVRVKLRDGQRDKHLRNRLRACRINEILGISLDV